MRRKRRKQSINWGLLIGVALVANIVAGVFASRLTSITRVRVTGVQDSDRSRVRAILQRIHSQPALQVNRHQTESELLSKSAIVRAEMTRNIFGRANLSLVYRRPIAAMSSSVGAALGRDGVIFQTDQDLSGLPRVTLHKKAQTVTMTLAGTWRTREVAGMADRLGELSMQHPVEIVVFESGGLCLNIGSKFRVELGSEEMLEEKLAFVLKQIADDPALVESGKTLNVVKLDRPAYRIGIEKREP